MPRGLNANLAWIIKVLVFMLSGMKVLNNLKIIHGYLPVDLN